MMKDSIERFEKVGQKVLMRYIVLLLLGSAVLTVVIVLSSGLTTVVQAIALIALTASVVLSTIVVLFAFNRVLAVTLVMVVREIAHAVQAPEGEETLARARVRASGQVGETVTLESPARAAKPSSERVEKKPAAAIVSAEKKCPYCGRMLPFGDIHTLCPYCGRRLR